MSRERINVLFVTHADKKGGAEQSLIHLINYMDTRRYKVFFLCPAEAAYLHEITTEHQHIPYTLGSIKQRLGLGYLGAVRFIRRLVKEHGIQIVHANGWRAPWYVAPLKFISRAKLVWHHRDYTHLKMYNHVLPRFFHQVICISHFVADSIAGSNRTVIYNGVDARNNPYDKTRRLMEDGELLIGTFGRIVEWKRYHLMIEAVKRLSDRGMTNWKLLIVGDTSMDNTDDYYDSLKRRVEEYGLSRQVVFHGYSSKPLELMSECDVTINFSMNEPFGRVVIESLMVKTPVIVADSGGAPEIIRETMGGIIVKDGDIHALAEALYTIGTKAVNYEELVRSGHRSVLEQFSMEEIITRVEQLYGTLLGREPEAEAGMAVQAVSKGGRG
ncbi:hypothetical protein DNH61_00240 [Paenibacillus sambharensis]|uniref:Glycosyltransferase family 1 protein n=1 Tax=Paenibacillus sambharensis TaxID=1803190 RepID=A0A2W1M1D5_9BACL|nr:glycosyltransferase family 4 protein [Paenibacillus sambharensis]PZD97731.1 hypothetical protein DNH61_00240 [Paenibacillus sambharensis]